MSSLFGVLGGAHVDVAGSAVVTGASRGIGRAVAIELADRGFDVVATMRDRQAGAGLEGASNGRLRVDRLDVTDPVTFDLPSDLRVLVNNAGVDSEYLPVEHTDLDDWRTLFETNVLGVVALTKVAIPVLRANRPSVVCNVTSSSILAAVPFYAAYRATKAAVSALSDTLRVELAPSGVRVVEIMPGPIDTDMFRLSQGQPPAVRFERYRSMAERAAQLRAASADPMVAAPGQAAARIVDAILDDTGPMRHGCDPLSDGLVELWRQSDDETLFALTAGGLVDPGS
jgi:NAD(P)-dependent dehydrogenase (short-subunit alcohol dehydrogenase family)